MLEIKAGSARKHTRPAKSFNLKSFGIPRATNQNVSPPQAALERVWMSVCFCDKGGQDSRMVPART